MYGATRLDADARSTKTGRPFWKIVVGQGDGFSGDADEVLVEFAVAVFVVINQQGIITGRQAFKSVTSVGRDRKSTRLNSSHVAISYAVFCWKKKRDYTKYATTRITEHLS